MKTRFFAVVMLLLVICNAAAQDVVVPDVAISDDFRRTSAQKGVKASTDVLLVAMPVATLAGVLIAQDWEGLKQGALTAATTVGTTMLLKWVVNERRPDGSNYHSFPSGHSSSTFATAAFLQRRYGWKFGAPAYALATYTAWGRVFAKRHHWWDVVAGAAIGAGSAYIFTRPWARDHNLSVAPLTDGRTFLLSASFTL
ncbi:MAG: phosphatase PAP2 family protein [Muribaculaceae bacterium]|nr:phosphatase PAP2 family protein [Muribaculaceae bacterium]